MFFQTVVRASFATRGLEIHGLIMRKAAAKETFLSAIKAAFQQSITEENI